ncbi:glycoside hydrolase family 30 protein [Polaribacter sp. Asnod1-A03]|uniref:glycoside hydrolase family 30 protein n=1 Tax=Polaribacter sp. Asnod1-A03 TaxID=3160581 RepID=UPI0038662C53
MKSIKGILLIALVAFSACKEEEKGLTVAWKSSTEDTVWSDKIYKETSEDIKTDATIIVNTEKQQQNITGFGGCFNELGWDALGMVTPEEKQQILNDLFSQETGCKFSLCRMPIGANDYAVDWYSHNETEGDFAMENFSIDRDKKRLIPYIKEAQKINPDVAVWASPWCPPSWMKHSKHYACKSNPKFNDLPEEWSNTEELVSRFITEPKYFEAYALYFSKFVQAYAEEGIDISAVHVQNEYNSAQNFPSCVWKPEDLGILISDYLGPKFESDNLDTEIWLGTVERPQLERVTSVIEYGNAKKYVDGVGFQWAGKGAIESVHATYPEMELMQTETECGDGSNDWKAAEYTFNLMKHYFENGANSYMYWNMVLDETGKSQWGWKQNSMISIDSNSKAITYNPEFYLMKHLSAFVAPGSVKLETAGDDDSAIVFYNKAENKVVVLAYNSADENKEFQFNINDKEVKTSLEAKSFNTLTVTL